MFETTRRGRPRSALSASASSTSTPGSPSDLRWRASAPSISSTRTFAPRRESARVRTPRPPPTSRTSSPGATPAAMTCRSATPSSRRKDWPLAFDGESPSRSSSRPTLPPGGAPRGRARLLAVGAFPLGLLPAGPPFHDRRIPALTALPVDQRDLDLRRVHLDRLGELPGGREVRLCAAHGPAGRHEEVRARAQRRVVELDAQEVLEGDGSPADSDKVARKVRGQEEPTLEHDRRRREVPRSHRAGRAKDKEPPDEEIDRARRPLARVEDERRHRKEN